VPTGFSRQHLVTNWMARLIPAAPFTTTLRGELILRFLGWENCRKGSVERSAQLNYFRFGVESQAGEDWSWSRWLTLASKGGIAPVRRGLHFLECDFDGKYLNFVFVRLHLTLD
jgi:hypothetical protein